MDLDRKLELLDSQITAANDGHPANFADWRNETEVVLRTIFGEGSVTLTNFQGVRYSPSAWFSGMDTSGYRPAGVQSVISILKAAKSELKLQEEVALSPTPLHQSPTGNNIFIVHGRDDARKHEVARLVRNLTGREPVILHEQPDRGQVLIEKFEANAASASYAIVLLTADDSGRLQGAEEELPRARQNVVFEMGYFFGALGRARTTMLIDDGVEQPSDVGGVVYVGLDASGGWCAQIAKNLDAAGFEIDWSALGRT